MSRKDFTLLMGVVMGLSLFARGDDPEFRPVPPDYLRESPRGGRVERLEYTADDGAGSYKKHAYVYLPPGYGVEDSSGYDTLYLMHGGSGSAETFFGGEGRSSALKNLLDGMIGRGEIAPLIVVTPSYYGRERNGDERRVREFHGELENALIGAVESRYRARSSRDHRAFGGFSMGSVTTWYTFIYNLDLFRYFLPMSGDCWVIERMGGRTKPEETADFLSGIPRSFGYGPEDFFIYAATGTADMAYENETGQIEAMKRRDDLFRFGPDTGKDNLFFMVAEGGLHTYEAMNDYLYNGLPLLFGKGKQ